jgi:murein DD-endopeptidase MepM/ murein hydrolase activator NlpD
LPFSAATPIVISEGWLYSEEEKRIHPQYLVHFGIDFAAARRTPVYAAASGWAIASYHLAFAGQWQGKRVGFGLGKFIQIWHEGKKLFTLYAHLDNVAEGIPFFEPESRQTAEGLGWNPAIVNRPLTEVLSQAKFVQAGELIGYVGDSGLSWEYDERPGFRPDPERYPSWDETHLHFEVYDRDEHGKKRLRLDPFDLYGEASQYQAEQGRLAFGSCPLWEQDQGGQPLFSK